jgi:hypothetical protein
MFEEKEGKGLRASGRRAEKGVNEKHDELHGGGGGQGFTGRRARGIDTM